MHHAQKKVIRQISVDAYTISELSERTFSDVCICSTWVNFLQLRESFISRLTV